MAKTSRKTSSEARAGAGAAEARKEDAATEAPDRARRVLATRPGEAALRAALEGARELWAGGQLQKAGREVVRGRTDLASALGGLTEPLRDLVRRTVKEHERVAEEDRPVEERLAEALRERPSDEAPRPRKRGGKSETVMRGVVRGPDGKPLPGLLVEGRRAGVKGTRLATDVTDGEGRYQLVIPNDVLGSGKSANVTLEIGLDRDVPLHRPEGAYRIATATATDHDVALPEEEATRAHRALEQRRELDVARVHALHQRGALVEFEKEQLGVLAAGLGALLGSRPRG